MAGETLAFGEVLWDLLPEGEHLGGAPLNFAYRMKCLDEPVAMVSRLGSDDRGKQAATRLAQLGLQRDCIQWDSQWPTGTVDVVFDDQGQPDYTIHASVAYDFIETRPELLDLARGARCFCFGTLAQRSEVSRTTCQRLLVEASSALKLLDVNLRKQCYTQDSVTVSLEAAQILKLNDQEVQLLGDLLQLQTGSVVDRMRELMSRHDVQLCLMTCGAQGVLAMEPQRVLYEPGFSVDVADPVGSGDAFTAGFCSRYLAGADLQDALAFGNAAGAWVASQPGATGPMSARDLENLIGGQNRRNAAKRWQDLAESFC